MVKNKNNCYSLSIIMSFFSLKQLFKKFEGHCNVFGKKRNDFLFAEYIVEYMKYDISHYSLIDAIRSFLEFLYKHNIIKYDFIDRTFNIYGNITYLDDNEIEKYQNNLLEIIYCNTVIYHGGVIESGRFNFSSSNKNIPPFQCSESTIEKCVEDSDNEILEQNVEYNIGDGGSKEDLPVINAFNEYHMLNSYKTKFITYNSEDKIVELKYYQSDEFWNKFVGYICEYSSDIFYDVFPVSENEFTFTSTHSRKKYIITITETGFKCTCPDHVHRNHDCKHIKDFIKLVERFMNE